MDSEALIRHWKARQAEILRSLPAPLRHEYDELAIAIRQVESAVALHRPLRPPPPEPPTLFPEPDLTSGESDDRNGTDEAAKGRRVPLPERKRALIHYLESSGPAARGKILKESNIPNGTLSLLLQDADFVKDEEGRWTVVPSTSVATQNDAGDG